MLVIEPPLTGEEWGHLKASDASLGCFLNHYCSDYFSVVLALPSDQIFKVLAYLVRGLENEAVTPDSFHRIVQRELSEHEYEASGKVARLVILCALAETLENRGYRLQRRTRRLINRCWQLIPEVVTMAIDDHFGLLTADCC
jgi:hypothetical protein